MSFRTVSVTKQCEGIFHTGMCFLEIVQGEMLSPVCFLQYEIAMDRVQKSKVSLYKKTMEVSYEV